MSGTSAGAKKAAATMLERYGPELAQESGRKGGRAKVKKGFAMHKEAAAKYGRLKPTDMDSLSRTPHGHH